MAMPSCRDIRRLQIQINELRQLISGGGTGGLTTITVGTVETVPAGSEYFTIPGSPQTGYVMNIGFPRSESGSSDFLGTYENSASLITANPNAELGQYGFVSETNSYWYWSEINQTFVDQNITANNYLALSDEEKSEIDWIIVP